MNISAEIQTVASRAADGDVATGCAESKRFFFEKKKQKTFFNWTDAF